MFLSSSSCRNSSGKNESKLKKKKNSARRRQSSKWFCATSVEKCYFWHFWLWTLWGGRPQSKMTGRGVPITTPGENRISPKFLSTTWESHYQVIPFLSNITKFLFFLVKFTRYKTASSDYSKALFCNELTY